MELIPIGTSSASVVKTRGLSAYALRIHKDIYLFDCGDGTQFRLLKAGIPPNRIKVIFISHLHGDHYLGLFGLLTSMSLERRKRPLTIVAPQELSKIIPAISGLQPEDLTFPIQHIKLDETFASGLVYQHQSLQVRAHCLDHGKFCVGFRVEKESPPNEIDGKLAITLGVREPEEFKRLSAGQTIESPSGKSISPDQVRKVSKAIFAYVSDTRPCKGGIALSEKADVMLHDATFSQTDAERASVTGHSTASGAAQVAKTANAKKLLLTHLSSRYSDVSLLENEAKSVFSNSEVAQEFHTYLIMSESHGSKSASLK